MNSSQGRVCLSYTEQGPALSALHPCLGVILGSSWICFSSPPKQQGNSSEFISPEEIVPPNFESLAEDSSCNHGRMRGNQSPA